MNRKQEILEEISANYHGEDGIVPGNNLWLVAPEKLATYLAGLEERIAGQTIKSRVSDELVPVPEGFREKVAQEKDDLESRFGRLEFIYQNLDGQTIEINKSRLLDFIKEEGERRFKEGQDGRYDYTRGKQAGRKEALNEALALFAQPGEDLKENIEIRAKLIKLL